MTTQQPLLLQVHPDDYERLEAAAALLGYSKEEVAKLFIHRATSAVLAEFEHKRPQRAGQRVLYSFSTSFNRLSRSEVL